MNTKIIKDWSTGSGGIFKDCDTCPQQGCSYCISEYSACSGNTTNCIACATEGFSKFSKFINLLGDVSETS